MRHQLKILILCLFLFPCSAFACLFSYCVGDSFYHPDIYLYNASSQVIMFTDKNGPGIVAEDSGKYMTFPADLIADSTGQTFSHTIDIHSAVDFKLICAIKTKAVITDGAAKLYSSISTDESKCHVYAHHASLLSAAFDEGIEITD